LSFQHQAIGGNNHEEAEMTGPGPWRGTFAGVFVAVFATFTSFGAVVPVLPRLVTERLDGSAFTVGAAFTATAVVAFLLRPVAGQLAQRSASRPVMTLGAALAVVAGLIYALPLGLIGVFAARLVTGAAEALVMTAGSLWVVTLAPVERRGQIVGWYGLAMWSGWAVGPAVGELLFRTGSYPAVWTASALLPALALAVLSRLPRGEGTETTVSRHFLPPASVLPGLSLAAGAFGYAIVASFGALALSARGIADGGVLLAAFGTTYVLVRLLAGRLPDRVGPVPVIAASATVEALGLVLIAFAPSWWIAMTGALIAGAGFTLLYPSLALITIETAPPSQRGAALGAVSSFFDIAVATAGFLGGLVAEAGYPAAFCLAAAIALTSWTAGTAAVRRHASTAGAPGPVALSGRAARRG
jgi:MFS family permease